MGALGAAKMGWNLYKHFSLVETSATAEERFGWMKASKSTHPLLSTLLNMPTMLTTAWPRPTPLPCRRRSGSVWPSRLPPTLSRPTDPLLLRWLKQATMLTTRPRPVPIQRVELVEKGYQHCQEV